MEPREPQELPTGMKMLLRSFGLTPEIITGMLEGPLKAFGAKVDELQATMNRVEKKLDILKETIDAGLIVGESHTLDTQRLRNGITVSSNLDR
jgi:hypothetical protein